MREPLHWHAYAFILSINTAIDPQENISGRVNNCKNCKCFPLRRFSLYGIALAVDIEEGKVLASQ